MSLHLAGPPTRPVPVPPGVRAATVGYRLDPVWRNELGGLTFAAVPDHGGTRRRVAGGQRRQSTVDFPAGGLDPRGWHPDHAGLDQARALALLADAPPVERAVVCHGDSCAPNTLIGGDGRWSGHVDLGRLGVADRLWDLAPAAVRSGRRP